MTSAVSIGARSAQALLPAIGLAVALLLWQGVVSVLKVDPSILPSPFAVLGALWQGLIGGAYWTHIGHTLLASLQGLAIGTAAGLLLGLAVGDSDWLDAFVYPVVLALQAMPVIAIAPLLIVWFGIGLASKVAIVALATFFPIFVNVVAGMKAAPADLLDLYRAYGASRLRTIVDIKAPAMLNYFFGGLQVAVALAILSCVVGEFLAANAGLGYQVKALGEQLDLTAMFAVVLVLAGMGALGSMLVGWLHRKLLFWETPAD